MIRQVTRRELLCGMCVTVICSLTLISRADEKTATQAVRNAGGAVRTLADQLKEKNVTLHLTSMDVTDDVLVHVAAIPDVAWLNLRGTKITDTGLANIRKMKTSPACTSNRQVSATPALRILLRWRISNT